MAKESTTQHDLRRMARVLNLNPDAIVTETRHLLEGYQHLRWFAQYCPEAAAACKAFDRLPMLLEMDGFASYRHYRTDERYLARLKEAWLKGDPLAAAVADVAHYPTYGALYHHILSAYYLSPEGASDRVLNDRLHIERSTYYSRKGEAVLCCGLILVCRLKRDYLTLKELITP